MINKLDVSNVEELKKDQLSTVMIWVDGCPACAKAKESYEEIVDKFQDYRFFEMEMKTQEEYDFYSQFVEKEVVMEEVKDEDGDVIYDARGNALQRKARDENGEIVEKAPIQVPRFFVFHGDSAEEENEFGFLGKVDGHNTPMLEQILTNIAQLQEEENEQD